MSPRLFSKAVYAEPLGNSVTTLRGTGVSAMLPTSLARSTDTAVTLPRVAVARKLAVILHRMWRDGTEFRWSNKEAAVTAS